MERLQGLSARTLDLPRGHIWAIEIKRKASLKVRRGFHIAAEDLGAAERLLVYAGDRDVPGQGGVRAMPLGAAMARLRGL